MRCTELKGSKFSDMQHLWEDAFNLIYSCGKFDHMYMANVIKNVQNKKRIGHQAETGADDGLYSGFKVISNMINAHIQYY